MLSNTALRAIRFRSILPPYPISALSRTMSSTSAYIVPFDHQSTSEVVPGLNAAELWATTPTGDKLPKVGTTRTFFNTPASKVTTVSSLGDGFATKGADAKRELLRRSVGGAVKELKAMNGLKDVTVDASIDPHAAGTHYIH
jgi:cytosol aminopeptidase